MLDIHSHILPKMDDGSSSVEESLKLLRTSAEQGITEIAATPHFYASQYSPQKFLERRAACAAQLLEALTPGLPRVYLGAEVCYFDGVSRIDELEALWLQNTNILLLEMPFAKWSRRMANEVVEIQNRRDTQVLLAHIERYLMGHSRPKYNSAVSTFCWAVANDESFTVNDRSTELELLYIDDLVEGMFELLEGKEQHCEFDGVETVLKADGRYCCVPVTHKVTLGEIVDLLQEFKAQPTTLMMPKMPDGSFAKKLYSLYLTYLPTDKFKYALKMNVDNRGSFTELVHTADCGQVSINISRPGITKGQHWHNSKWELFIVVAGHGLIQERNINTGETVEFEVSGDKIEAVHMIPGWTHNIINLSETENLVTVMTCNEIFNPNHPDTFFEPV